SMISAGNGSSAKVIGRSSAMVAVAPMPGRTPIIVPRMAPVRQYRRFCTVTAAVKPMERPASRSIRLSGALGNRVATGVDDLPGRDQPGSADVGTGPLEFEHRAKEIQGQAEAQAKERRTE